MSLAVRDVCDEAFRLAELFKYDLHDFDVGLLVVSADVVYLADSAVLENEIDRSAVILNIEPVSYVQSLAVNRQRLVRLGIRDHERDQLLRELVRTVVV